MTVMNGLPLLLIAALAANVTPVDNVPVKLKRKFQAK